VLHFARIETATSCNKMQGVETSLYARSYARLVPRQATASQVTTSVPVWRPPLSSTETGHSSPVLEGRPAVDR
jgi:hypothetical protein